MYIHRAANTYRKHTVYIHSGSQRATQGTCKQRVARPPLCMKSDTISTDAYGYRRKHEDIYKEYRGCRHPHALPHLHRRVARPLVGEEEARLWLKAAQHVGQLVTTAVARVVLALDLLAERRAQLGRRAVDGGDPSVGSEARRAHVGGLAYWRGFGGEGEGGRK